MVIRYDSHIALENNRYVQQTDVDRRESKISYNLREALRVLFIHVGKDALVESDIFYQDGSKDATYIKIDHSISSIK